MIELPPLRGCTHTHHLSWDERYAPYIQEAGMLDLARVVTSGLPPLDPALLTALVDRWRPETHTFHLPCGEMTITLEDTAMILGLPMDGSPVIHRRSGSPWGGSDSTLGCARLTQSRYRWSGTPGPSFDSSGDTVDSALLPILDWPWADIATFSWASCTLAHIYRQLCDGCQRKENSLSIGGCLYLLQVWSWERLPIGRPVRREREEWAFEDSRPTVLWFWRDVEVVTSRIDGRYKRYTNELDCVTHRQVEWTPYYREEIEEAELSPLCRRDEDLWRAVVPLIFFVVVEYHIPTHVLRQFGRRQVVLPHMVPTDLSLHRKRRQGRYSETDWRITHVAHTGRWTRGSECRSRQVRPTTKPTSWSTYAGCRHIHGRAIIGEKLIAWYDLVSKVAHVVLGEGKDIFAWNLNKNGFFSVSSMYSAIVQEGCASSMNLFWALKVPLNIKIFLWYLKRGVVLTKDNLARRAISIVLSVMQMKRYNIFSLPATWQGLFGIPFSFPLNQILLGATALCWAIWLSRNDMVFNRFLSNSFKEIMFKEIYWIHCWAKLSTEDDKVVLEAGCRKLEAFVLEFFGGFGWRARYRIDG
ncbi:hypothetical protein U9M48_001231 [Paspalum notatum var. saurae]|uniref:Aminotransferase-like plant mobile domain-containing protein n=1 Tax=Paspalum notatum var. saurae TaxID=547442 RepID=A0AAQ3PEN4_PASNO